MVAKKKAASKTKNIKKVKSKTNKAITKKTGNKSLSFYEWLHKLGIG